MRTAIYNLLSADAALMATLTGGLHNAGEVGEISRQTTPEAFDANGEILPCGLLKLESTTPWGVYDDSARLYLTLMLYQRVGSDTIDVARRRIFTLLNKQVIRPVDDGACWEVAHAGDTLDAEDQALGCSLAVSRFVATIRR